MAEAAAVPRDPAGREPARGRLAEHFESLEKQEHAAHLGMWIFLVGELLLFSGLFALYAGMRGRYPTAFAEGAGHTVLWMGTTGTFLLLLASFLVAWAVHAVRDDRPRDAGGLLWGAALLGAAFLGLKLWEYAKHAREGLLPGRWLDDPSPHAHGLAAFFNLYYVMTGAHAVHVLGGMAFLVAVGWRARRGAYDATYHVPLELGGMYWHLVDLVWLFLWPFFYLLR